MQSSLATLVQERRGHDRVLDAVFLKVLEQHANKTDSGDQQFAEPGSDLPNLKVSLSVSGIAFADRGLYQPGDDLELQLILFPSKQNLKCRVKIVSAGDAPEVARGELLTYRASFIDLPSSQLEILSEHVDGLLSRLTALTN